MSAASIDESSGDRRLDDEVLKHLVESPAWRTAISSGSKYLQLNWQLGRDESGQLRAEDRKIYGRADSMPRFEGGGALKLRKWLRDRLGEVHEPVTLVWSFVVEKDGAISDVRFDPQTPGAFTVRVTEALQSLPRFVPGRSHGDTVRVRPGESFVRRGPQWCGDQTEDAAVQPQTLRTGCPAGHAAFTPLDAGQLSGMACRAALYAADPLLAVALSAAGTVRPVLSPHAPFALLLETGPSRR